MGGTKDEKGKHGFRSSRSGVVSCRGGTLWSAYFSVSRGNKFPSMCFRFLSDVPVMVSVGYKFLSVRFHFTRRCDFVRTIILTSEDMSVIIGGRCILTRIYRSEELGNSIVYWLVVHLAVCILRVEAHLLPIMGPKLQRLVLNYL